MSQITPSGRREIRERAAKLRSNAAYRARKKGLPCTITTDWVEDMIERNACEATGLPFDLRPDPYRRRNPYAPSLDRIRNDEGYTPENTKVVITGYNIMRNEMSEQEMLLLCTAVLKRRNLL